MNTKYILLLSIISLIIVGVFLVMKENYQVCTTCANGGANVSAPNVSTMYDTTTQPISTLQSNSLGQNVFFMSDNGNISTGFDGVPIGTILMWMDINKNNLPRGWAFCDGSTVQIGSSTSFTMPNFSGRFPVGAAKTGANTNLAQYNPGDAGGEEFHKLVIGEMPNHSHYIRPGVSTMQPGTAGVYFSDWQSFGTNGITPGTQSSETINDYAENDSNNNPFISYIGGDGVHNNMPPFLAVAFIMKLSNTEDVKIA